jgi:hypothetical protein
MRTMERYLRAIAGSFVLLSLLLGFLYSPYWHLFTAFVGLNLLVRLHQMVPDGKNPGEAWGAADLI